MSVINRADAIKALEDVSAMFPYRIPGVTETYRPYNEAWNDAIDKAVQAIEALPDADDGWIPIEDGLPEVSTEPYATSVDGIDEERFELHESERVLVACIAEGYTTYGIGVVIYDAISKTTEWNGSAFGDYDLAYPNYCKVIAWMPLPPAFKPKEDK